MFPGQYLVFSAKLNIGFLDCCNSGDLEVTVDFLTDVDKLVQLIESPIFTCRYSFGVSKNF